MLHALWAPCAIWAGMFALSVVCNQSKPDAQLWFADLFSALILAYIAALIHG